MGGRPNLVYSPGPGPSPGTLDLGPDLGHGPGPELDNIRPVITRETWMTSPLHGLAGQCSVYWLRLVKYCTTWSTLLTITSSCNCPCKQLTFEIEKIKFEVMEWKENTKRRSKTFKRVIGYCQSMQQDRLQAFININTNTQNMDDVFRFVYKFLPEFSEMRNWEQGVDYSLKKKGREAIMISRATKQRLVLKVKRKRLKIA